MVYNEKINQFLDQLKIAGILKIIAFSGSCLKHLENRAENVVDDSFQVLRGLPIAIQTGGTEFDIQKFAADRVKKYNMPLIGIYPSRGEKYKLKNLDFALEVKPRYGNSEWGDETEIFAKVPDGVELIGGSLGTLIEFGHLMKINDSRTRKNISPVYIAPVTFPREKTTADVVYEFPLKEEQRQCFPPQRIEEDGNAAAKFLVEKLGLKL